MNMRNFLKALPFLLNGVFYIALGVFTIIGSVPAVFTLVVASVGMLANVWLGVKWNPPQPIPEDLE